MNGCKKYHALLLKYIADEIHPRDLEQLRDHAESCPECAGIMETHASLNASVIRFEEMPDTAFQNMRQDILRTIRTGPAPDQPWFLKPLERLRQYYLRPAFAFVFAVFLFFSGFLGGMLSNERVPEDSTESALIEDIRLTTRNHKTLDQTQDSPYYFSSIRLNDIDGQTVAMSFNVCRNVSVVRPKDDPLIHEILAQALVNQSTPAGRMQMIDYTESMIDPKIKQALLVTIKNDPVEAVRFKALTRLSAYPPDPSIQEVLIGVLETDESISMRLLAIDYLTQHQAEPELIRETVKAQDYGKYAAVRRKAMEYVAW